MTVTDLLQSAQFVVDAEGNRQAVQFDTARWEELVVLLKTIEAWEQEWGQPFEAIRIAWETSSPASDEEAIPDDEQLVDLGRQIREERRVPYILTRDSRPQAVLISYEEYLRFQELQEQAVMARFDQLVARMAQQQAEVDEAEVAGDIAAALAELDD